MSKLPEGSPAWIAAALAHMGNRAIVSCHYYATLAEADKALWQVHKTRTEAYLLYPEMGRWAGVVEIFHIGGTDYSLGGNGPRLLVIPAPEVVKESADG